MTLSRIEAAPLAFPLGMTMAKSKVWPAASLHDGISFSALTGKVTIKAPGGAASVMPLASAFTFTGGNQSMYMGPAGLLVPSVTNTPRIEYGPGGDVLGLLMEASRTNLAIQSEDYTVHAGAGILSMTANAIASPSGAITADKITEDTGVAQHRIRDAAETAIVSGGIYTQSVYVKAGERTKFSLRMTESTFAASCEAHFDLLTGAVSAVSNAGTATGAVGRAESLPNGWWRCSLTGALNGGFVLARFIQEINDNTGAFTYTGDGVSGLYIWGEQIEAGAFPSSYIPTTTVSVARTADSCIRTLASEFSATAGTVVVAGRASGGQDAANAQIMLEFSDGTSLNRLAFLRVSASDSARFSDFVANVQQGPIDATFVNSTNFKASVAWATNDLALSFNGAAASTDVVASVPTVTQLTLGAFVGGGSNANGHIRTFDYYPTRLTNAQLQQMSS